MTKIQTSKGEMITRVFQSIKKTIKQKVKILEVNQQKKIVLKINKRLKDKKVNRVFLKITE